LRQSLLICILLCSYLSLWGQNSNRIIVDGIIFSNENDVEAITIFNTSSNKGTITNKNGEFVIAVALNDKIEVSAIQFRTVLVVVDADVIKSKQLKIQLIEEVNQLDAVVLSSGLSGNIEVDISNVKVVEPITIDMGNMNIAYEYNDDKAFDNKVLESDLNRMMNKGQFYGGINFAKIFDLVSILTKKEKKQKSSINNNKYPKGVLDIYSSKYISETFNIPEDNVSTFIDFIELKGVDQKLLESENEIHLIEFLVLQRDLFIKQ